MDEKMQSLGIPFCGYFGTGSKKKFIGVGSEVRLVYQIDPDELVYGTLRIQKTDITISEKVSPTFLDRGYSAIFVR